MFEGHNLWHGARRATQILALIALCIATTTPSFADGENSGKGKRRGLLVPNLAPKAATIGTTTTYSYFPSASTTDGRFLAIVGNGLQSLAGDFIEFGLGMPSTMSQMNVDVFDGETGGTWDLGTTELEYVLFADPKMDGSGTTQLAKWEGSTMKDNDWYTMTVAANTAAKSASGDYFFRMRVRLVDATQKTWSNFKLRTNGTAMLLPRAFSFAVPLFGEKEARIIYPNYPDTSVTTYDGTWTFNMQLSEAIEDLDIWDGDMDFGSADGVKADTDDHNTPNEGIPAWAEGAVAVAEGVATSNDYVIVNGVRSTTTKMTGAPADDNLNYWYRRSPSVAYDVIDPIGIVYANDNPSGNLEWERFRIGTITDSAANYDYTASVLPAGAYSIKLKGMDLGNLNAWRMTYGLLGARTGSTSTMPPVSILGVSSIGDALLSPLGKQAPQVFDAGDWTRSGVIWPVADVSIGDMTLTKSEAIAILGYVGCDMVKGFLKEVIAAKLNVSAGAPASCIVETLYRADELLLKDRTTLVCLDYHVAIAVWTALYKYNNGYSSCAPSGVLNYSGCIR